MIQSILLKYIFRNSKVEFWLTIAPQKLLKENRDLSDQLDEKTLDYDSMKTSCRVTQRELNLLQSTHQDNERRMVSTSDTLRASGRNFPQWA